MMTTRMPVSFRNAAIALPFVCIFSLCTMAEGKKAPLFARWECAKMIDGDGERPPDLFQSFSIGEGPVTPLMTLEKGGYLLRIVPDKTPAKITLYRIIDNRRVIHYYGIYKFLGDTLVLALSDKGHPDSFEPKENDGVYNGPRKSDHRLSYKIRRSMRGNRWRKSGSGTRPSSRRRWPWRR
ncbi:hypothetical protein [Tuwongella immobilis]|uniref:Uncharacterized protein n=1 Tax=Tuwongella immobilis TaxID=692036 RepID=A0A6C2YR75_9BACT|nr:hypothetical protein [Tuwongella immobilis]VIP03986.1 unnamed protein product [Tuwongella immobilis]VTS05339.1 unnamed protein product [Tuwongella immobilis]